MQVEADETINIYTTWPPKITALAYLLSLRPALPLSAEKTPGEFEPGEINPSNGEVRRWLKNKAVLINGRAPDEKGFIDLPVTSLVFFPKGKRRTTLI
jgi:hypothetical protein